MKTYLDCIPCFIRQALEAARMATQDEAVCEQVLRRVLDLAASMDMQRTPPEMAQKIHNIIREVCGVEDPYLEIKQRFNSLALDMLPGLERRVESSADPFGTAVRLALAGNIIDFGTPGTMAEADVSKTVEESLTASLHGWSPARMKKVVDRAGSILYIGDNAGEIVFDRLLIEQIGREKVTFAVRGGPAINDALRADADSTGISEMVRVIDSGVDAPGTPLSLCSPEFLQELQSTNLIISKGQGNYETLSDLDRPVFFLFRVKCPLVSRHLDLPNGTLVIEGRNVEEPPLMPDADLYLDKIDFECHKCGDQSCKELVEKIEDRLPRVPALQLPRPVEPALVELNDPRPGDPVLVTGNSEFTQAVLLAVMSTTTGPFFVLFCDTKGDTLDMAIILKSFTPERIKHSMVKEMLEDKARGGELIIPGLAADLKDAIAETTGWPVRIGPVCAAELPLFFGDQWVT